MTSGGERDAVTGRARAGAFRRGLLLSFLFGVAASIGVALYGDVREVGAALAGVHAELLLPAATLGLAALALRGLRWHWYLRLVAPEQLLPARPSAEVYLAGVAMKLTPGGVGEWVKSHYVEALGGAPAARSSPIVLAERITDMLGLVLLASAGLLLYRTAFWAVGLSALLAGGLLFSLLHAGTARLVARWLARAPVVRRLVPHVDEFYGAARSVLTWRTVPAGTAIAFLSWACEAGAYWFVLWGVGVEPSWTLLLRAAFIWPVVALAGGLLLTPAGLGVAEGGLAALAATLIDGLARGPAAAAALLARLVTLWLGVLLGLLAMALLARRLARRELAAAPRNAVRG